MTEPYVVLLNSRGRVLTWLLGPKYAVWLRGLSYPDATFIVDLLWANGEHAEYAPEF